MTLPTPINSSRLSSLSLDSLRAEDDISEAVEQREFAPHATSDVLHSTGRYLAVAFIVAVMAGSFFIICPPFCFALLGLSGWFVWSAVIIPLNHAVKGTCIATPIHRLHAVTLEINSIFFTIPLFPLTFFKCYHRPKKDSGKGIPVLMVNGYLSFGSTFDDQKEALEAARMGPIHTMNVGTGRSIKTYAEQVANKVEKICAKHNTDRVILVGHSKGGLVSTYCATQVLPNRNNHIRVVAVITMGSPLAGTPVAHLGLGYDAGQMKPNSPFIQELTPLRTGAQNVDFYHIASKRDEVVPFRSALPEDHEETEHQFLLDDMGHLGLVFDRRVTKKLIQWIRNINQTPSPILA